MISALFILNQKGEVLISKLFRPDLKLSVFLRSQSTRSIADIFRIHVISNPDVRSPIITLGSTSFFHVRHQNLYITAVTKTNANAALVFELLYRIINIAKSYFGKVDEEAVKNNFVMIYELLDEILDFGYPQNSEIDTLKMYITTESIKSEQAVREDSAKITIQATGATSWRRNDVKYRKNEAFVDVVETVNLILSSKGIHILQARFIAFLGGRELIESFPFIEGTVLRADVDGQILMRAYLTGTPECKFGLNDKLIIEKADRTKPSGSSGRAADDSAVELDDCQFHQCVKLGKFDSDRTISFIPPDGEFELMRYRSTTNVQLPFRVHPIVEEIGKSKVEFTVHLKANFDSKLNANSVVVKIPTPLNTTKVSCKTQVGKAKYVPEENVIIWKIPRMQGQSDATITASADLISNDYKKSMVKTPHQSRFSSAYFLKD
ncbi:hypothetical protein PSHT_08101 [Puccinia striiformis]|uniref:MHD domain-containing protein n=1 Tax=Puccinia striiformis TaxID=27350 RepID=A0A2S4VSB4_9BASI|nr:hypothetical protein PSHT_08101 [Puccinia striiformis]